MAYPSGTAMAPAPSPGPLFVGIHVRMNINVSRFLVSYVATNDNVADGGTKALNKIKQLESAQRLLGLPEQ